jgi:hypothetical protein
MSTLVLILVFSALVFFVKGVLSGKDSDFYIWLILGLLIIILGVII